MAIPITITITQTIPKPDPRYTVKLYFVREDRPKYWTFYCPHCKMPVAELDGQFAYGTDIVDDTTPKPVNFRFKCQGRYCKYWYQFVSLN